jgi:hypothetical protein
MLCGSPTPEISGGSGDLTPFYTTWFSIIIIEWQKW